jgi:hypothetical protein
MEAGADARRALEIAIARNPGSGGEIQVVDLHLERLKDRVKGRPDDWSECGTPHLVDCDGNTV